MFRLSPPFLPRRAVGPPDAAGPGAAPAVEAARPRRPAGRLIWLHASGPAQEAALVDLVCRLVEDGPVASFLLTAAGLQPPRPLPTGAVWQETPADTARAADAFLEHWRPDLGLWAGMAFRPALIEAARRRGLDQVLIDAAAAPPLRRDWRVWIGVSRPPLSAFGRVLATDDAAAAALVEAGAARRAVEVAGPLEEEAEALPCSPRERDAVAEVLKARPVWLAVALTPAEEAAVVSAHRMAARLAHRLLLILVPEDPARGPELAARLMAEGHSVALRSVEGEPEAGTEVFVADGEGELGLWYRLAPVTFMGGTLDPGGGGGRSPLEPAALGSAILHGPALGPHGPTYGRFLSAGAARGVRDETELGAALSDLLSPDRAATMAHAAWRVSTGGAETAARVLAIVNRQFAATGEG